MSKRKDRALKHYFSSLLALITLTIHSLADGSSPPGVGFANLLHRPLGEAKLDVTAEALTVANLGSSGQDGVNITTPPAKSLDVTFGSSSAAGQAGVPIGSTLRMRGLGVLEGKPDQLLARAAVTRDTDNQFGYRADFTPLGSSNLFVQVYRQGQLLAELPGSAFTGESAARGIIFDAGTSCNPKTKQYHLWIEIKFRLSRMEPVTVGGTVFDADEVRFMSEDSPYLNAYLTGADLLGTNLGALTVTGETVTPYRVPFRMHDHFPLGQATLALTDKTETNRLVIANLGSSGQDGVSISLPPANALNVTFASSTGDPQTDLPVGSSLHMRATGVLEGKPDQPLLLATVTRQSSTQISYKADFSPLGSSNVFVQLYRQGALLAQLPGSDFSSGSVPLALRPRIGVNCDPVRDWYHLWVDLGFQMARISPVAVGGVVFDADEVRFMSEDSPYLNAYLTGVELTGAGLGALTLADEAVESYSVPFRMHEHTPLGQATLAMTDPSSTNRLLVGNLGSSGQDGVSLTTPAANSIGLTFDTITPDGQRGFPEAGILQFRGVGVLEDKAGQTLIRGSISRTGASQMAYKADFTPLGSSNVFVQVYRQGQLLAELPGSVFTGEAEPQDIKITIGASCDIKRDRYHLWITIEIPLSRLSPVTVGGTVLDADEVRFMSEDSPFLNAHLTGLDMFGTNLGTLSLLQETVQPYSVPFRMIDHSPLGQAALAMTDKSATNRLVISNLGSSGQDGVEVNLKKTGHWTVQWDAPELGAAPSAGAGLDWDFIGTAGSVSNGVIASVSLTKRAAGDHQFNVELPFTTLKKNVKLYRGTELVAEVAGQSAVIGASADRSTGVEARFSPAFELDLAWASVTQVMLPDGSRANGDRVVISPDGPPVSVSPAAVSARATGLSTFAFVDESSAPAEVRLSATLGAGKELKLEWSDGGTLQESGDLKTWLNLPSVSSPYTPPLTGPGKFYRVAQ